MLLFILENLHSVLPTKPQIPFSLNNVLYLVFFKSKTSEEITLKEYNFDLTKLPSKEKSLQ